MEELWAAASAIYWRDVHPDPGCARLPCQNCADYWKARNHTTSLHDDMSE
jgi:hypothetical protein